MDYEVDDPIAFLIDAIAVFMSGSIPQKEIRGLADVFILKPYGAYYERIGMAVRGWVTLDSEPKRIRGPTLAGNGFKRQTMYLK